MSYRVFPNTTKSIGFDDVWKWSEEQIVQFLTNLADGNNNSATLLVDVDVARVADVHRAAGKIVYMLNHTGTSSVSAEDLTDQNLTFWYLGQQLHFPTVYDQLGFILSATGTLPAGHTTTPNYDYFLPMLSLYANWCNWLAAQCMEPGQQMQHISYFPGANHQSHILLGSSIGSKNAGLRIAVLKKRTDYMTALGLTRPQSDKDAPASNYGVCAETMLYIYYASARLGNNVARGFALNTNEKNWLKIKNEPYDADVMEGFLRPPCQQSCQHLMPQLHLDPATCFSIQNINET